MREIKFRAWHKDLHHMYYDEDNKTEPNLWTLENNVRSGKLVNRKSSILMQYTGLTDKNGKEIYEGDIIEIEGIKSFVVYRDTSAGFRFNSYMPNGLIDDLYEASKIGEVVGNIYENPDLLEAK